MTSRLRQRRQARLVIAVAVLTAQTAGAAHAVEEPTRALTGPWKIRICYSPTMRAKEPRLATMQNKMYDLKFGEEKPDGSVAAAIESFPGTLSMIANFKGEDLNVSKFFQGVDPDTTTRSIGRGFLVHDKGRFIGTWRTERGSDGQWIVSRTTLPGCDAPEITIVAPTPPRRGREMPIDEFRRNVGNWWSRQDTGAFAKAASWGEVGRFTTLVERALKGVQVDPEFLAERARLKVGSDAVTGLTIDADEYERLRKVGLTQYPVGWIVVESARTLEDELVLTHEAIHMMYFGMGSSVDVDGLDLINDFTGRFATLLSSLRALETTSLPDMMRTFVRAEFDWPQTEQRFKRTTELRSEPLKAFTARPWSRLIGDFMPRTRGRFDLDQVQPIAEQLLRDARAKAEADRGTLAVALTVPGSQAAGATLAGSARVTLTAPADADQRRSLVVTAQVGGAPATERRLGVVGFAGRTFTIDLATFGVRIPSGPTAPINVSVRFGAAPDATATGTATLNVGAGGPTPKGGPGFTVATKPFGRPQYLIHVTARGSSTGTEKVDFYAIHADKPDGKGNFVAPDGRGGTRGYGSDGHSGPHANPAAVCAAAAGKVDAAVLIPSFTSSANTVRCA